MRKRLREDWTPLVYNFWCRPIGENVIDDLIAFGRKQNTHWNALVALWRDATEQASTLPKEDKEAGKALWESFWETFQETIKQAPLGRSGRADLDLRFRTAVARVHNDRRKFFADLKAGRIDPGRRSPRLQFKPNYPMIEDFHLSHHDGGGGLEVGRAFEFHNTKRWRWGAPGGLPEVCAYRDNLRATRRERLCSFFFGLEEGVKIPLELLVHRPLPGDALVKAVSLTGRYNRHRPDNRQWSFSLQVTLETPPRPIDRHDDKVVALDLGWRVMGDRVRFGMLLDSEGNHRELSLPLRGERLSQRDRGIARLLRYAAKQEGIAMEHFAGFDGLREIDKRIGLGVEGVKSLLEEILPSKPVGWARMRQRGLWRLMDRMEQGQFPAPAEALDALKAWAQEDTRLQAVATSLEGYCIRRRRKLYEQIARELVNRYRYIVWEGDLKVKALGEIPREKKEARNRKRAEGDLPPLSARQAVIDPESRTAEESGKYRMWVAIGEFRSILAWQAKKAGCTILPGKAAHTTRICHICGEAVAGDRIPLMLTCPNGHAWDQDLNACRNLMEQAEGLRAVPRQEISGDPSLQDWREIAGEKRL